jgi:hypothetical protein
VAFTQTGVYILNLPEVKNLKIAVGKPNKDKRKKSYLLNIERKIMNDLDRGYSLSYRGLGKLRRRRCAGLFRVFY